jgi:DNA-binding HxlR family transcriptional regulator
MRLSECPVRPAIDVIEGKWKPIVVNALKLAALRFRQLRRHTLEATTRVLTDQLRELEQDQIISRKAFGQKWERVEYRLTAYGRTLVPVLPLMAKWGKKYRKLMDTKKTPALASPSPNGVRAYRAECLAGLDLRPRALQCRVPGNGNR